MKKPAMIIDVLAGHGPGDDESEDDESPLDDEEARAPRKDPEALIANIESQLAELRRSVTEL